MLIGLVWSKRIFFILSLLAILPELSAQIIQAGRVELSMNDADAGERFKAIGLDKNGIMVYQRLIGKTEDQLEMTKLDTTLHEDWKGYIGVPKNLVLAHVQYNKEIQILFLLFKQQYYLGGDFFMASVRVVNGSFGTYLIKNLIPFNPSEFVITGQAAMIGGYFNYRPLVLYYNFALQQSKILPGFFNEQGELNQLKAYPDGSLDVVVCARNYEKKKSLWIRNYDAMGELVKTTVLQPDENKNLLFGRSVKLSNGEQIVAGVYGRFTDYSRGIFVAGINTVGEYGVRYYNFSELKNFFSYMKAKRQKRIKDRIERRTVRGKKIKFNYRFLIHDILPYKDQYIMTGEAFYPHYTYPSSYNYGRSRVYYPTASGFGPGMRNDLVFDGYQYTHAVVVGFDSNGKIQWDNSFEINDVKTMQLQQFVEVKPEKDRIVLMYLFENKLRSKIIRDSEVLEGKTQDAIKPNTLGEKVDIRGIESEQLNYWYGNYFYAFGVQKLMQGPIAARRIFFINKLTHN